MGSRYNIGLQYDSQTGSLINFEGIKSYIASSHLFDIKKAYSCPVTFLITTADDASALFTPYCFYLGFSGHLGELHLSNSIKSTIEIAEKLKKIRFDPNFLRLILGHFDGEAEFINESRGVAEDLQKRFYSGGDVWYAESSNDFQLFLCAKKKMFNREDGNFKKLLSLGASKPVSSLDELLHRIEQS